MAARVVMFAVSVQAVVGLRHGQRQQRQQHTSSSCGLRGSSVGAQIINGQQAKDCDWIWQAQVRDAYSDRLCGATLISDSWVLTAAECVRGKSNTRLQIVLGSYDRVGSSPGAVFRNVSNVVIHPRFNRRYLNNNLALVELSSPVPLGGCIGAACLPDADTPVADGTECWISGWGITVIGDYDAVPEHLQEGMLTTVPYTECKSIYADEYFPLSNDSLCASGQTSKGEFIDACHGDYGGPLVCQTDGVWYLHGVSSFSFGCAEGTIPGVWARTDVQRSWINNITGV